jgi:hypothetical protein
VTPLENIGLTEKEVIFSHAIEMYNSTDVKCSIGDECSKSVDEYISEPKKMPEWS